MFNTDNGTQDVSSFKPRDLKGAQYFIFAVFLTSLGIGLSLYSTIWLWLLGQFILAIALLQWFIILHEAGHKTLFRRNSLNTSVGIISSILAGIPYSAWKYIHFRHHKWTGWQDLDATTESLVPREINGWQRIVINFCWKYWIPLFSILYRVNNYWFYARTIKFVKSKQQQRKILRDIIILSLLYILLFFVFGLFLIMKVFAVALLLSLILQEILLLSQHTHIPTNLSRNTKVRPYLPMEQQIYTRSLQFPNWISKYFLMHFDAHELHHMYIKVPGYDLRKIDLISSNEVNWITWIKESKGLSGVSFLFENKNTTDFKY